MNRLSRGLVLVLAVAAAAELGPQQEQLLDRLKQVHGMTAGQEARVRAILAASRHIGQGNPAVTEHPMTSEECLARRREHPPAYDSARFEKICGARYMAPLYDPKSQTPEQAPACIDQFEFPNIPCEYPVVWVRAREAALICQALDKRICDAHEWEGGCEGRLLEPDYRFDLAGGKEGSPGVNAMRQAHNQKWGASKTWAYGGNGYRTGVCGGASHKDDACQGGSWSQCGSNTYPAGSFPDCHSGLWMYDMHGNAAEHMNLPLNESQMAGRGSTSLGYTEMKGSWFIFDKYYAHQDWCRWRAPYWHGTRLMDADSHHNYHLGFRCCKTTTAAAGTTTR